MKILKISLTLLASIVVGFILEMVKVNINYTLETASKIEGYYQLDTAERLKRLAERKIDAPYDYYHNHMQLKSLYELSEAQLTRLKWIVTLAGTITFLLLQLLLLHFVSGSRKLLLWTCWIYVVLFSVSLGIYFLGTITGTPQYAYGVSRKIAGALQSLVPVMFILPGWWLWQHLHSKKSSHDTF